MGEAGARRAGVLTRKTVCYRMRHTVNMLQQDTVQREEGDTDQVQNTRHRTKRLRSQKTQKRQKCGACFRVRCALGARGGKGTCLHIRVHLGRSAGDDGIYPARCMVSAAGQQQVLLHAARLSEERGEDRVVPRSVQVHVARVAVRRCTSTSRVVVP